MNEFPLPIEDNPLGHNPDINVRVTVDKIDSTLLHITTQLRKPAPSFYRAIFSIKTYKIPTEWVDKLKKADRYNFHPDQKQYPEKDAIEICREYLKITDKNWWPTLLGMNEIMDRVLDEEFRKI